MCGFWRYGMVPRAVTHRALRGCVRVTATMAANLSVCAWVKQQFNLKFLVFDESVYGPSPSATLQPLTWWSDGPCITVKQTPNNMQYGLCFRKCNWYGLYCPYHSYTHDWYDPRAPYHVYTHTDHLRSEPPSQMHKFFERRIVFCQDLCKRIFKWWG